MSGIAVITGSENKNHVGNMLEKLQHRGPDGDSIHIGHNAVLGCVSLKVNQKTAKRLRHNSANHLTIAADARIYNYKKLRKELPHADNRSDMDVLIELYKKHGPALIERLDGIFSFAIGEKDRFLAVRDPLGVKALYYAKRNGSWHFASELKAFAGKFRNIKEFPPGHIFDSQKGFKRYFKLNSQKLTVCKPEEIAQNLKEGLSRAVRKRLPSDGNAGILLSGGLDSSIIGYLAGKCVADLHSFTAGIEGGEDVLHARNLAKILGTKHREYVYTIKEMTEALPQVIYHLESFDYLLVRSSIVNYMVSKLAGDYVKVALCGEGSDELFAGYSYLKKYESHVDLNPVLEKLIFSCHNTGLQRVDRMNMANGIEGRMPYFDMDLIKYAFTIPARYKLDPETKTEKWILRKAFEKDLPEEITWRKKQKFSIGAGSYELMSEIAESKITDAEFNAERKLSNGYVCRNKEELMYYRIFKEFFGDNSEILNTVGITPKA